MPSTKGKKTKTKRGRREIEFVPEAHREEFEALKAKFFSSREEARKCEASDVFLLNTVGMAAMNIMVRLEKDCKQMEQSIIPILNMVSSIKNSSLEKICGEDVELMTGVAKRLKLDETYKAILNSGKN